MQSTYDEASARHILQLLQEKGFTMQELEQKLEGRVSWRTLYRWAKGEHEPQRPSDLRELRRIAKDLL
jgi:hypothetical protein